MTIHEFLDAAREVRCRLPHLVPTVPPPLALCDLQSREADMAELQRDIWLADLAAFSGFDDYDDFEDDVDEDEFLASCASPACSSEQASAAAGAWP